MAIENQPDSVYIVSQEAEIQQLEMELQNIQGKKQELKRQINLLNYEEQVMQNKLTLIINGDAYQKMKAQRDQQKQKEQEVKELIRKKQKLDKNDSLKIVRKQYSEYDKNKILEFRKNYSDFEIEQDFKVSRSLIYKWSKSGKKRKKGQGSRITSQELEDFLNQCVKKQRQNLKKISIKTSEGTKIFLMKKIREDRSEDFPFPSLQ